jgi:hypothetical protein
VEVEIGLRRPANGGLQIRFVVADDQQGATHRDSSDASLEERCALGGR